MNWLLTLLTADKALRGLGIAAKAKAKWGSKYESPSLFRLAGRRVVIFGASYQSAGREAIGGWKAQRKLALPAVADRKVRVV